MKEKQKQKQKQKAEFLAIEASSEKGKAKIAEMEAENDQRARQDYAQAWNGSMFAEVVAEMESLAARAQALADAQPAREDVALEWTERSYKREATYLGWTVCIPANMSPRIQISKEMKLPSVDVNLPSLDRLFQTRIAGEKAFNALLRGDTI